MMPSAVSRPTSSTFSTTPAAFSPWLLELPEHPRRPPILKPTSCDVLVIGGGIAGISTAQSILEQTGKSVLLVDAQTLGSGATGHNAGYVSSYMEVGFGGLAQRYGIELAVKAKRALFHGYGRLTALLRYTELYKTVRYDQQSDVIGYMSVETLLKDMQEIAMHTKYWPQEASQVFVAVDHPMASLLPANCAVPWQPTTTKDLQRTMETHNPAFFAYATDSHSGVMNSALFTVQLAQWLEHVYHDRLHIAEHSPVLGLHFGDRQVVAQLPNGLTIRANEVVVCTNGYRNLRLNHPQKPSVNLRLEQGVNSIIGYMLGYETPRVYPGKNMVYIPSIITKDTPYFYFTRRAWQGGTLVAMGGVDEEFSGTYSDREKNSINMQAVGLMSGLLKESYAHAHLDPMMRTFHWNGVMGYTNNATRWIGPDPDEPRLLYNLGCNGCGIISSLVGAEKIGSILAGKPQEQSVFDVDS